MKSFSSVFFNDLALFLYGVTGFVSAGVIAGRIFPSMFSYTVSDKEFYAAVIFVCASAASGVFFRFLSHSRKEG